MDPSLSRDVEGSCTRIAHQPLLMERLTGSRTPLSLQVTARASQVCLTAFLPSSARVGRISFPSGSCEPPRALSCHKPQRKGRWLLPFSALCCFFNFSVPLNFPVRSLLVCRDLFLSCASPSCCAVWMLDLREVELNSLTTPPFFLTPSDIFQYVF